MRSNKHVSNSPICQRISRKYTTGQKLAHYLSFARSNGLVRNDATLPAKAELRYNRVNGKKEEKQNSVNCMHDYEMIDKPTMLSSP